MKINIQEIINQKIKDMEDKGIVEKTIQDTLEKTIISAIVSALDGYSLKRDIENKISKEVSSVVADIGFTAYNSFIAEKVKAITEDVYKKDIAEKIKKAFNEILVVKRESVKISEICKKYRDWICEGVEESEKYSLERFYVSVNEDERFHWLKFKFGREEPRYPSRRSNENSIEFTVHRKSDNKNMGWISSVYIDGYGIDSKFNFRYMSDIELLLINIAYNKTPIEIDVESEDDIDCSFDVDI